MSQLHKPVIDEIYYPESDGQPMAENTIQYRYLVLIKEGLEILFAHEPNVFIAGDLFWYPVEGDNETRLAPDVMVAIGRPKGDRGSYQQWKEGDIAPQIVFEIWSPGNREPEKRKKFKFYERYGVQEYYTFNPDKGILEGWLRREGKFRPIIVMHGWVSPRLGIKFEVVNGELIIYRPDGQPFVTPLEIDEQRQEAEREADLQRWEAEQQRLRADQKTQEAEQQRLRAEKLEALLRKMNPDLNLDQLL